MALRAVAYKKTTGREVQRPRRVWNTAVGSKLCGNWIQTSPGRRNFKDWRLGRVGLELLQVPGEDLARHRQRSRSDASTARREDPLEGESPTAHEKPILRCLNCGVVSKETEDRRQSKSKLCVNAHGLPVEITHTNCHMSAITGTGALRISDWDKQGNSKPEQIQAAENSRMMTKKGTTREPAHVLLIPTSAAVTVIVVAAWLHRCTPAVSDLPGPPGGRRVSTYKKCHADEVGKQYRALTTVPTIMRLSVLALFIALPAAALRREFCIYQQELLPPEIGPLKRRTLSGEVWVAVVPG
ncbi:hypothetical protein DFH94DRAFT_685539 [Russula ochroleuca]|uniref:Uncharacterized protein n=1 Tax=Russula ochroleuca TaxID=152965 RepID=A0A9P5JWX2_9AGAM|nr:hypothetical protein DFH94DRAFT_685539 [Russula ochroleuca]